MRIITGTLKGQTIEIPSGLEVRPTTDRTKESMFAILESHWNLQGILILDLFAGSGSLGFEAISRGAKRVTAIELNPSNVKLINRTAKKFGIDNQVFTRCSDVSVFLESPPVKYDIIFADPPYDYPNMPEMVTTILNEGWLAEQGWLLLEHDKRHTFKEHEACILSRAYGRTTVSIFES